MKKIMDNFYKCKIKKGDLVKVITGKEKGKEGEISEFCRKEGLVKIPNLNMKVYFEKEKEGVTGGIKKTEGWIHISNVELKSPKKMRKKNEERK